MLKCHSLLVVVEDWFHSIARFHFVAVRFVLFRFLSLSPFPTPIPSDIDNASDVDGNL